MGISGTDPKPIEVNGNQSQLKSIESFPQISVGFGSLREYFLGGKGSMPMTEGMHRLHTNTHVVVAYCYIGTSL